jgi:hypothetical protein
MKTAAIQRTGKPCAHGHVAERIGNSRCELVAGIERLLSGKLLFCLLISVAGTPESFAKLKEKYGETIDRKAE